MKKLFAILLMAAMILPFAALAEENTIKLPAYVSTEEDPIEAAVANYTVTICPDAYHEDSDVMIPAPVIIKIEKSDENHASVYGNFWHFYYHLNGKTLECISGGEAPGIMELEKKDDVWTVTKLTIADDGDEYYTSISEFCAGDTELEDKYYEAGNINEGSAKAVREHYLAEYVKANQVPADSYQDYGWDAIPLDLN